MRLEGSRFQPRLDDVVINWGNTHPPTMPRQALGQRAYRFLNEPEDVARVSNKLSFFQLLTEDNLNGIIPEWWQSAADIPDNVFPVVCRTILNGHSGRGIVIANTRDELVPAPLYTKYIKKNAEYRVHIGHGLNDFEIIAVQQKRRNRDVPDGAVNWQVRNHQNGFIYARQDVEQPPVVTMVALAAFTASGLDFGAVDVVYNERLNMAYVLEINSAPGLEGTTLQDYTNFFNQFRRD
jgi:glutathione synthase/RimK-type ligase-like ATP-grasp enzyme